MKPKLFKWHTTRAKFIMPWPRKHFSPAHQNVINSLDDPQPEIKVIIDNSYFDDEQKLEHLKQFARIAHAECERQALVFAQANWLHNYYKDLLLKKRRDEAKKKKREKQRKGFMTWLKGK